MEAIAAFVFARGGAARPDEIEDLFMQWPELRVEVLASGASLKKAVKRDGATHGLVWRDEHPLERGPVIVHEMTEAQRDGDVQRFTEASQLVPHALATLETFVRTRPERELRSGALYDFYNAFPRESAFMKRRSGGVVAFARQYDPMQRRFRWDDRGGLHAQWRVSGVDDDEHPLMSGAQLGSVMQGQSNNGRASFAHKEPPACQPAPEPESTLAADSSKSPSKGGRSEHSLTAHGFATRGEKSQDELREATVSIRAASLVIKRVATERLAGVLSSRTAAIECVLWLPGVVGVLERVNAALANAREMPRLHPFGFLVVLTERRMRSREAWRAARWVARRQAATQASSALGMCLPDDLDKVTCGDDERERAMLAETQVSSADPAVASLVLSSARGVVTTIRVALDTLLRMNVVLLQATLPPALHPLVIEIIMWIRREQSERAERAMKRSTALSTVFCSEMMFLLIPRATREHLSFVALSHVPMALAPTLDY